MPAEIHPTAIIASGAEIGDNVSIGPYCCIGDNVRIGNDTVLHQSVIIDGYTDIGEGNEIFPHAVLGKAPQHTRYKGEASTLTIGHNNLIREHVTMHPGTEVGGMVTRIGSNGMFMAGSHIAHDCVVEDHVIFSNYVQVGGHVHIGKHCYLGALVGVHPFVRIGRNTIIGGLAKVESDIIPFSRADGNACYVDGINIIGLERNGFSKASIKTLRRAYKDLFKAEGSFEERLARAQAKYAGDEDVKVILDFITSNEKRAIMQANRNGKS